MTTLAGSIARRLVSPMSAARAISAAVTLPISSAWLIGRAIWRGLRRRHVDPTLKQIVDPTARYVAAVGEADRTAAIGRQFSSAFLAATIASAWVIVLPSSSPLTLAAAISCAAALWLAAVSTAFAHWQARSRRLGGVQEWLSKPGEWLPPGAARSAACLVLLAALAPVAARAAAPVANDQIAQAILSAILPIGGAGTAATHAIGVMSSTLSLLGAAALAWSIMSGIVAASSTGQLVSERTSAWAPIRVVLGIGMLMPMPSGLSAGHAALLQIAGGGSTLATSIATGFFTESLTGTAPDATGPNALLTETGQDLAHEILSAELCADMRTTEAKNLGGSTSWIEYPASVGTLGYAAGDDGTGPEDTQWWDFGPCGSVSLPITTTPSNAATFSQSRIAAVSALIADIRESNVAGQMADENGPWPASIVPVIQSFINGYNAALQTAATTFVSSQNSASTDRILTQLSQQGWPVAGAYAMTVSNFLTSVDDQASVSPDIRPPSSGRKNSPGWAASDAKIDAALRHFDADWKSQTTTQSLHAEDLGSTGDNSSDFMTKALAPISKRLSQALLSAAAPRADEPLISVVSLGHDMLLAAEAGTATGLLIATAANTSPSKIFGGDGAWGWVAPWIRFVIDMCYGIGTFLAYYVPVIPTISMYWLLLNWTLLLAEAAVAMPVLAFLFCRLEGQELVDSVQKPGISILFNLYFKPAFGVLGLILAQLISPLLINALALIFPASYAGAQGGHFVGIVGQLFGLALFSYLIVKSQIEIGQLITLVPDRIPRWMGMAAESTGGSSSSTHAAVLARTGGAGGKAPGSKGGGGGGGGGGGSIKKSGSGGAGERRSSGRNDPNHWSATQGGAEGLNASQIASAQESYGAWAKAYPENFGGTPPDFDSYVSYVQSRRAGETD